MIFATTSQVSVENIDAMWPLITDQHEHDFARKAYRDGFGLLTKVRHRKELTFATNEETGETYEFYVITSVADVEKLKEEI
jgi:hypothetical protein